MVQRINRDGRSILIVEQNAKMALAVAHYAYVLELGEIAVHGLSQDLLRDPRVTQCYLGGA
jgi:branched-chain amino acid transport system ATP-binding protein